MLKNYEKFNQIIEEAKIGESHSWSIRIKGDGFLYCYMWILSVFDSVVIMMIIIVTSSI